MSSTSAPEPELNSISTASMTVGPDDLASAFTLSSEDAYPAVFATARMIALMEIAAARGLRSILKPNQLSVGVGVNVAHTAATLPGDKVTAEAKYVGRENGKLFKFEVIANDSGGQIGRGIHTRAIIEDERLLVGAKKRSQVKSLMAKG